VRVVLRILALIAIPVGIAALVSFYADEPGLETRAREAACAREGARCHLRLARMARMPWKRGGRLPALAVAGGRLRLHARERRSVLTGPAVDR